MDIYTIKNGTMRQLPALEWWAWGLICFAGGLMLGLSWKIGG